MPGTFIIKPIEANLTHNTDIITKMNPYCAFNIGGSRIKSQICKKGGKHPHWNESITLPVTNESTVLVELMDKDRITHDDLVGSFMLDLSEIQSSGQVSKWYPLSYKNKAAGEILLEAVYQPGEMDLAGQNQFYQEGQQYAGTNAGLITDQNLYQEEQLRTAQPEIIQKEEIVTTTTTTTQPIVQQQEILATDVSRRTQVEGAHVWTEQHQVVEPHTFIREVEVVETRSALKEIEVMEPVKVLKDVAYTQAVPVRHQIEVTEPQVVIKEVEVIEPRLVSKTIQVVENVPVKRQVEVVEMRNTIKEVETFEPQTLHKQVEVTEYVPHLQQVEVTQPVTLKKAVEFVEPVITTQTITKEMQPAIIIDEKFTTEVGPASVIGMSSTYGYTMWNEISLSERQRLSGLKRWVGYETIFGGLTDEERLWEQQRLSRLNEQEWLLERQRLMGMNEKDRLYHQRGFFQRIKDHFSTGRPYYQHSNRWKNYDNWFMGLNDNERYYTYERFNRLNDQEWNLERQRLEGLNDSQRINDFRTYYNNYQKAGGFNQFGYGQGGFNQGFNQGFTQGGYTSGTSYPQSYQNSHRWKGLDNWFSGLNDKERNYTYDRFNRFNDQEWNLERQRLQGLSDQDRITDFRKYYGDYQKAGGLGFSQGLNQGYNQSGSTYASTYHPSPNF